MTVNTIEENTPPVAGYQPPAVSIRATYTVGDVHDELAVDIDKWNGDVSLITGVIEALTERRPGADVQVDAPDVVQDLAHAGATVRALRSGTQTISAPQGQTMTFNASGAEGQA